MEEACCSFRRDIRNGESGTSGANDKKTKIKIE
jgi:hypothetical protein